MVNNNLFYGIITVLICLIVYFFSWKFQSKDGRYNIALILLLIGGGILRMYTATDFFLHAWDERYHALVAKHLMMHPFKPTLYENPILYYDLKNWCGNHIWLHKQPFALWCMAASMKLFGVNEIALRLPSILISTFGIYLTFYIGRFFFNKKVGYIAAFLQSINGFIIELTAGRDTTDHIDVFFLFFIELAIFFTIKFIEKRQIKYNILAGLGLGIAILSKWLPALIVLPIWLLLIVHSKKFTLKTIIVQFIVLTSITTIVFLPWQLFIHHAYPLEASWEGHFNALHITEALEGHSGNWFYYIDKIRINYGDLIYLPLLWFAYCLIKQRNDFKYWALCIWVLIPLLFFSYVATKMQGYMMFTAPALFIITGAFYDYLITLAKNKTYKVASIILRSAILVLAFRYSIERVKPFQNIDKNPEWVLELKKLNTRHIKDGVLLNYPNPIEAMFYTNLTVYEQIPSVDDIKMMLQKKYKILICDNGNLPKEITSIKGIELIKLKLSPII